MLVLTRRENEKIILPAVHASVEVLEVKAGRVRLGIQAPRDLQILREEVMKADDVRIAMDEGARDSLASQMLRKAKHQMRNDLNKATIGLALARRQLQAGLIDNLDDTLDRIGQGFSSLGQQVESLVEKRKLNGAPPQALLVEDDTNECELLAGFLRMAGYKVNTAGDGADAIDFLRNGLTPDIMLLDMNLPRCDGPTTIRMIRRDPSLARLKIFAVTGYSPDQLGIDQQAIGVDRWFQKPLNPESLLGELNAARAELVSA